MSKVHNNHPATKPHHGGGKSHSNAAHAGGTGKGQNNHAHGTAQGGLKDKIKDQTKQIMHEQMQLVALQQKQLLAQLNAQIAGLKAQLKGGGQATPDAAAPQPTAAEQAAQAAAEAQAKEQQAAQQAAFAAYQTQALAQFSGTAAAMQQTFASSMQGFGSLESSLGGFLNQGYAPAQFNGGAVSLTASASLFSGPISVPQFFPGTRRY